MPIHPTAIVDPQAQLAPDVDVGPWCRIDGPVAVGSGSRLLERVTLKGPLRIGVGNIFYPHSALGFEPQDRKFDPARAGAGIVVGDRNLFREGVTIHRATGSQPTTIGNDNFFMVNSHLGHDVLLGNGCTIVNGALVGGHGVIGDGVILGGNAAVHQFCRIGRLAMLSGGTVVSQDVPPFCTVYYNKRIGSLNLVGLRRNGLRENVRALREAFDIFFRQGHANPAALALIDRQVGSDPAVREFTNFIRLSKRGITAYASSDPSSDEG